MPIRREQFDSGELDIRPLLIEFLRSHSDNAYTLGELRAEISAGNIDFPEEMVRVAIVALQSQGRVETRTIAGVVYYMYSTRIGFRTS